MVLLRYLLSCIFFFLLYPLMAQEPAQPIRLELPLEYEKTDADLIALPDSSLLLYYKINTLWQTSATFNFTKYNTRLEPAWADTVSIPPDSEFLRQYTEAPYTYFIFGEENRQQYTIVRVNYVTGQLQHKRYKLDQIEAVYEFVVLEGNYFIIGHNTRERKPQLWHIHARTGKTQQLPSIYGDQSTFSDLLADPENGRVDAVLAESNGRITRLQVKAFDAMGKLLDNRFILQQESRNLLNAEVSPGDSTRKLLLGTYGTRDLQNVQGFFTAPLAAGLVDEEGAFYSMLQLKNFFKYLKPRQEERLRRREGSRLKQGKKLGYRYRLLLHDLIVTPTGYVLAAEVYFPQYISNNNSFGIDRAISMGRRQQEGYKRTHAVAIAFDAQGKLLWDNIFPLKGLVTAQLVHTIEVGWLPDGRVVMAYPDEEKIIYQVMDQGRYNEEETETEVLTYAESDKIQDTIAPGIIKWYGNHFAAFGFQRIKSKEDGFRTVFYINKISF
ncbi:hypothetical protein MKJ04_09840 [Pontibacter sp. E15-1]|uniref:hypothetical protein n=1 Tax=Pontibacter sp. E15-1 TaxID=2919918 RepID=UPI001F4F9DC6|nr:hypothetical protein [Pontibacter sp. E15-1]MCJ8165142.1 hypothetical protein [Pontibacter sp. E15-1]